MLQGMGHSSFYPAQVQEYMPQIKLSDSYVLFLATSFEAAGHFRSFSAVSKRSQNIGLSKSGDCSALPYDSAVYSLCEIRQII